MKIVKTKACSRCQAVYEATLYHFYARNGVGDGLMAECKICHTARQREYQQTTRGKKASAKGVKQYRKTTRGKAGRKVIERKVALKKLYGITPERYSKMLQEQGGKCAICGGLPIQKRLAVDHDHETGKVRGLLCACCNMSLGQFEVYDVQFIMYLHKYRTKEKQ